MEPEVLLPCLQETTTCPCPKSDESTQDTLYFFKIHFNIIRLGTTSLHPPLFRQSQCIGTIAADISFENKGRRFFRNLVEFCDIKHRQIPEDRVRKP
jgi:hypothetical protein